MKINEIKIRCKQIAQKYEGKSIDCICGLATGGILPGYFVADYLGKKDNYITLRPNKPIPFEIRGLNILIVDDIVDSGKTKDLILKQLPTAYFEAVIEKPTEWITFPWESSQDVEGERQTEYDTSENA